MNKNIFGIDIDDNYDMQFKLDHTGMSSYSNLQKESIVHDVIKNSIKDGMYVTNSAPLDQKLTSLDANFTKVDTSKYKYTIKPDTLILKSLIYNLYIFGTFKYGRYLLIGSQVNDSDHTKTDFLILDTDKIGYKSGVLQSCLDKSIAEFVDNHKNQLKNNLERLLNKHGYKLTSNDQRKYLFGKAHMILEKEQKIALKSDLNVIFEFMSQSKKAIKDSGSFKKIELDLTRVRFLKVEKAT